jgi:hypothetical protein
VPVIVTPLPLGCAGGAVRDAKCVCPAGLKTVKAAPNAFRCVQSAPEVLSLPKAGKVLSLPKAKQRASSQKLPVLRLQ